MDSSVDYHTNASVLARNDKNSAISAKPVSSTTQNLNNPTQDFTVYKDAQTPNEPTKDSK